MKLVFLCLAVAASVPLGWASPIFVPDSSFENVNPGAYPFYQNSAGFSSPSWVFQLSSGVDPSSGTWFTAPPPDGTNAAFLQELGVVSQTINGFTVGATYEVDYWVASRPNYSAATLDVTLGGIDLGTHRTLSNAFAEVTTSSMTANGTSMQLQFQGMVACDCTSIIDMVTIREVAVQDAAAPEPGGVTLVSLGLLCIALTHFRRMSC